MGTEDRTSNNVNASVKRSLTVQVIPEAEPTIGLCNKSGGFRRELQVNRFIMAFLLCVFMIYVSAADRIHSKSGFGIRARAIQSL